MRGNKLSAAILLIAISNGCMPPPPHVDPFAELQTVRDSSNLKGLNTALLITANTKNAVENMAQTQHFQDSSTFAVFEGKDKSGLDGVRLFKDYLAILQRNFKSVVRIEKIEEAPKTDADIVAVLDIYAQLESAGGFSRVHSTKITADLIMVSRENVKIDVVHSESQKSAAVEGFRHFGSNGVVAAIEAAVKESQVQLEKALLSSTKLQAFAKSKAVAIGSAIAYHSDIDTPPSTPHNERPDSFALIVGVEKYSNDLPEAQFAERDAQAVKDHLLALGYPERNIKLLTGQRASFSAFTAYLEDWLPRSVDEKSQVFFYFSGHGAPDPTSSQAYLVPWDGNPNFLEKTSFPVKKLYADLNVLKARQVIVALDSCFSGAGGRSLLAEGTRPLVNKIDVSVSPGGKILLFAAASPREVTSTLKEQGHGIFTYYFLKGLAGAAKNESGAMTPRSLYEYLKPKVQDAASRQNREQTPVLEGTVDGEVFRFK